jgi:RHS repeat-associated protein
VTTQFLYDRLTPVQELTSGTPTANLLTGLNIDEFFTRTEVGGSVSHYLTDVLGSIVALLDASGTTQTSYQYEPFGDSTTSGAATGNAFSFTSRESDGTGLSYYRARYYDSRLQRFIAEDPLGFQAGDVNLHSYVANAPTTWTDPTGMAFILAPPACRSKSGKNPPAWLRILCEQIPYFSGAFGPAAGAAAGAGTWAGAAAGAAAKGGDGSGPSRRMMEVFERQFRQHGQRALDKSLETIKKTWTNTCGS